MKNVTNVAASAARTTSGTSSAARVTSDHVAVLVNVTAVSGTSPSMTVELQWSNDGTTWFTGDPSDVGSAITAAGAKAKSATSKANYVRAAWTITGTTPSFTFSADIYTPGK